ncbi:bifunctional (p)ppGpp synthetase/guanosine-3',5'-bis(diphosphate) 3'-pyrophosphohydrolase [Neolewinella aurantiaca]|uniref:Bifunctional (P)ppGpp synthetase/guanosine-3',5'-bis(Diphosphate) 3'-pyrophosphohydrolase n=1 Tax=Neolewinella aurantiaca TaxID=2602767 RepID=A0A5C7FZ51_9BACT|nr:RelA/SpoT family protein [Neolewinella aurantiaca]TXF91017.1 bifunctional (p)ppGpp synthetase/guanosine-3',5'-bis(diphosphate) 3'-pyrophosphohydrolase [Neolewinella aurantiaca]
MAEVLETTVEEQAGIRKAYEEMLACLHKAPSSADREQMDRAMELANYSHRYQRRKSGEPYIYHPIAVARICAEEIGLGPTAICAALLHDVVEDTPVTLDDLRAEFGERISLMVGGLTKLDSAYNNESQQAANFKKVLGTLIVDVRIVLIKMADRLHNMRTIKSMPEHKQFKIAAETSYIYAPLAHRLGLYNFRSEFLDLCMKVLERDEYDNVAKKLRETKSSREQYIERFIEPMREGLDDLGYEYRIYGRPKSIYSIYNKIKKKQVPFEQIYDLFAVRIVMDVPRNKEKLACWAAYSVVTDVYQGVPERLKDWVTIPKSNGYESLHTTVAGPDARFVEVQIRSERMNEIAERGFAAHWKYKGVSNQPDVYEQWFDSVRDILDDPNSDTVQFLGDFRDNAFFNEEVYVWTPDGDMKSLPKGATALDFAFSVHTEVGYHCQSVLVDERIVPLSYKLRNGDRLKVITNKSQKPNEGWLQLVITGKAKAKIRQAMKADRKEKGELGKEALLRKLKNLHIKDTNTAVEQLAQEHTAGSHIDLFFNIAQESLSVAQALSPFIVENGKLVPKAVELPPDTTFEPGRKRNTANKEKGHSRLLINGEPGDQFEYSMATCCNPVQGDQVFAYLTANAGLKIHRSKCPNAQNLMANYGYRIMKAEWVSTSESSFVVHLVMTGTDSGTGVIETISREITGMDLNIRSFNISGQDGYFEANVSLLVKNTDQLYLAIQALKNLDHVSTVSRVEE